MKSPRITVRAALVTASLLSASSAFAQQVIYRENFGNNTAGNLALSNTNIGWIGLYTTTVGGNLTNGSATTSPLGVSTGAGAPTDLASVNSGTSLSQTAGNVFNAFVIAGLDYTTEYTIDRNAFTLQSVSWFANRGTGASGVVSQNFAVQIGGNWYVTTPPAANNVTTSWAQISVNLETTTWNMLSATAGAPISVGATTALPGGNISAFGIYYNNGANAISTRFDTLQITAVAAVPEPSSFAALAGLAALGLVASRRRARA